MMNLKLMPTASAMERRKVSESSLPSLDEAAPTVISCVLHLMRLFSGVLLAMGPRLLMLFVYVNIQLPDYCKLPSSTLDEPFPHQTSLPAVLWYNNNCQIQKMLKNDMDPLLKGYFDKCFTHRCLPFQVKTQDQ